MVYLLHFARPVGDAQKAHGKAQHYIGSAWDVQARCKDHAAGRGARLLQAVEQAEIPWQVARLWDGGRRLERKLKARKDAPKLCPICSGEAALRRGEYTLPEIWDKKPAKGKT